MKSRRFTKPAQQPQEDLIVESMDIVTMDLIDEGKGAQARAMRISEPKDTCAGCSDCDFGYEDRRRTVGMVQQRTTTLNNNTVCSCSGCMASQTVNEPVEPADSGQRPTRICLETVLSECDQIRALFSLLAQPKSN